LQAIKLKRRKNIKLTYLDMVKNVNLTDLDEKVINNSD